MKSLLEKLYRKRKENRWNTGPYLTIEEEEKKLINYIQTHLERTHFKKMVFVLLKNSLENELLEVNKIIIKNNNILKLNISEKEKISINRCNRILWFPEKININNNLKEITLEKIYLFMEKLNDYKNFKNFNLNMPKQILNKQILELLYKYYFNKIAEPKWKINKENNLLEQTYIVLKNEEQYKKYKLIQLSENRSIHKNSIRIDSYPYYLEDKNIKKFIEIQDINYETLKMLISLKNKNIINKLSLRPNYYVNVSDNPIQFFRKKKEFGKYFYFKNLNHILPTKLYSLEGDSLWINIDKENITFEEISNNFEIVNDDTIITQVLHCEYFLENNDFFIKHMDHEYIFYSLDEFEKRQNNIKQKGSKFQRVKTFKIDNSKIPFILNNKNILLFFLNQYFESKKLLLEYFNKIES